MKLVAKSTILCLFCGIFFVACKTPQNQITPKIADVISVKIEPIIPKDTALITKKDTVIAVKPVEVGVKPDSIKVLKDTTKQVSGEQIFQFYEVTPAEISFSFPSHSIVMIPVNNIYIDKGVGNSFCEYWLYTKDGKLVCYCKNTVSGLHPVYSNSYNPNNHLPEFTKKIGFGDYRLVYKNISKAPVKQNLVFGLIINENKDQIDVKVSSGETKEFWIKVYPSTSSFKMNNNNKESF